MNENKLKNFLVNGFQALDDRDAAIEESSEEQIPESCEQETAEDEPVAEEAYPEEYAAPEEEDAVMRSLQEIEDELLKMRYVLEDLRDAEPEKPEMPDMTPYLTSRETLKAITSAVEKRDAEVSNKTLVRTVEQISVMREDFFKLCQGMRERIDTMSAEDVLSSFEAYSVDMENILSDAGVYIGPFPYDRLNTLHQRIIGVVPTDEQEKNGTVAERLSDGYKIGNKVLLKEKVKIYKFTGTPEASETPSKTDSETEEKTTSNQEEEE